MKKIIGTGAAGNKAAIKLINDGVVSRESVLLINTTSTDIPIGYEDIFIKIGEGIGGAGKERIKGKQYLIESISDGKLDRLDSLLDPSDNGVIIITSTEGGSGSGSTGTIAQYFKDVIGTNVHIVAFTGFEDDVRALGNTVEFFKDLDDRYVFEVIANKKFMDECGNNTMKACEMANEELSNRLRILLGQTLVDCKQNIDQTDLYKVINTPGLITVESAVIKNLKNQKQFNDVILNMIDSSKSIDINGNGVLRLAVILNINEKTEQVVDFSHTILKLKLGIPFETFQHIQYTTGDEYISIIASGMQLPKTEIQDMYDRYQELLNRVNTKKDDFFENISTLDTKSSDQFNVDTQNNNGKDFDSKKSSFLSNIVGKKDENSKNLVVPKEAFIAKNKTEKY